MEPRRAPRASLAANSASVENDTSKKKNTINHPVAFTCLPWPNTVITSRRPWPTGVIVICRLQERGAISPAKMQFDAHDRSYAPRIPFGCDINTDRYLFGRETRDYCIINLITAPVPRQPSAPLSHSLFIPLSRSPVSPLSKPPRSTRIVASLHR